MQCVRCERSFDKSELNKHAAIAYSRDLKGYGVISYKKDGRVVKDALCQLCHADFAEWFKWWRGFRAERLKALGIEVK